MNRSAFTAQARTYRKCLCGHDQSLHKYCVGGGPHDGPKDCGGKDCACLEFVSRRRAREVVKEGVSA